MAALSVFVTEPTLDWLKRAEESAKELPSSSPSPPSSTASIWSPEEAIRRTERALDGAHPSHITCEDLKKNIRIVLQQDLFPQLISVVRGSSEPSGATTTTISGKRTQPNQQDGAPYRSGLPPAGLTVEQQVGKKSFHSLFSFLFSHVGSCFIYRWIASWIKPRMPIAWLERSTDGSLGFENGALP